MKTTPYQRYSERKYGVKTPITTYITYYSLIALITYMILNAV